MIQAVLDTHPLTDADYFHSQDYHGITMVWHFDREEESNAVRAALRINDTYQVNVGKQGFVVKILVTEIHPVEMTKVEGKETYCHRFWAEYM